MPEISFDNLLIVISIAVAVPLLLGPRLRVPAVVIEIIVGVIVGPSVLDWVQIDLPVEILAVSGLAFLLFPAGLEIDLRGLRGTPLQVAVLGYLVSWGLRWVLVRRAHLGQFAAAGGDCVVGDVAWADRSGAQ